MTDPSVPLTELAPGQQAAVFQLRAGWGLISRLATLGFTPGAPLTMVQNYGHGPLIVRVRDSRIALGRTEAAKIIVRRNGNHG
jgi:ferrous iron transport protein A